MELNLKLNQSFGLVALGLKRLKQLICAVFVQSVECYLSS
jgi:hypothetical protein